jgi:hypothetical protein
VRRFFVRGDWSLLPELRPQGLKPHCSARFIYGLKPVPTFEGLKPITVKLDTTHNFLHLTSQ